MERMVSWSIVSMTCPVVGGPVGNLPVTQSSERAYGTGRMRKLDGVSQLF